MSDDIHVDILFQEPLVIRHCESKAHLSEKHVNGDLRRISSTKTYHPKSALC